ncbi:MAG: metallophosphoesterase family protein [Actinomycetota bacterium]
MATPPTCMWVSGPSRCRNSSSRTERRSVPGMGCMLAPLEGETRAMEPPAATYSVSTHLDTLRRRSLPTVVACLLSLSACGWTADIEDGSPMAGGPNSGRTAVPDGLETSDVDPPPDLGPTPSTTPSPIGSPPVPAPFHFVALGDLGTGTLRQQRVADRLCRWRKSHPFDLVLTTGDNIYQEGEPENFPDRFFAPYRCLFSNAVNFHSSLGNHDILTENGRPEIEEPRFGMLARNYVVRRAGVRFVMANSNSFNLPWLRDATRSRVGDRWTIVVFHHPVYSSGEHGSTPGLSATLRPIFESNGVDLVLNGHDHLYSTSRSVKGIRYVVTGGGGARLYGCGDHDEPKVAFCRSRYHFLDVTVGLDDLVIKAVPPFGRPFHRFSTRGL